MCIQYCHSYIENLYLTWEKQVCNFVIFCNFFACARSILKILDLKQYIYFTWPNVNIENIENLHRKNSIHRKDRKHRTFPMLPATSFDILRESNNVGKTDWDRK